MELLFKDTVIGTISGLNNEDSWVHGIFEANEAFNQYKEFFRAIVCEEGFEESKFNCELLNDENWSISKKGSIAGIYIPAIYEDGDISFRYR
ncbi:hypothetical protein [Clostridium aciditolerans]|uniref:Uncharacterized protein n=1 Tax=Clostridium aciditolerans TaxID=339861 RepID=A0A934M4V4_9CLOT|nr:hypothetical protein [Clostridium aciditolerans]MBI6871351.1 hypothetical protein [Clostridium aciditolerans]